MKFRGFLDTIGGIAIVGCTATGLMCGKGLWVQAGFGFAGAFALTRMIGAFEDRELLELNEEFHKRMAEIHEGNAEFYKKMNEDARALVSKQFEGQCRLVEERHELGVIHYKRLAEVREEERARWESRVQSLEIRAQYWKEACTNGQVDILQEEEEDETPELCQTCTYCSDSEYLLCAVNPMGPSGGVCAHYFA